ncbi:hypothetical protein R3I94_003415 [Phoxinus phoxinus]|jgi:hypothetical protein
MRRF